MQGLDRYVTSTFAKFKTPVLDTDAFMDKCKQKLINFYAVNDPKMTRKQVDELFKFTVYTIRNGEVTCKHSPHMKLDGRVEHNRMLIENTLKYCKEHKLHVPDTKLYFWISDRVPWELGDYIDKYPFFVYATPKNVNNVIFPDNTFVCLTLQEKYGNDCWDWDAIKRLFNEYSKQHPEKQKTIYFKGTPTTRKIHRLREALEEYAKTRTHMVIRLDAWQNYEPVTKFNDYMFLLNLPGKYPWSNRFKFLFLTDSIIINVNVFTKGINQKGWNEDEYITFMDLIMKPNKDYINIDFTYYNAGDVHDAALQQKARSMVNEEISKTIQRIENVYNDYDSNKKRYQQMVTSYRKKITSLSNESIYKYIYKCIVCNAKIVKG